MWRKKAQVIGGPILLTLGALFILDRLTILEIYISWPLLLLAISLGLFLSNALRLANWIVGGIGMILFVGNFIIAFFPEVEAWSDLVWPTILIIVGVLLVYRYYHRSPQAHPIKPGKQETQRFQVSPPINKGEPEKKERAKREFKKIDLSINDLEQYYQILGLPHDGSEAEIKSAYLTLVKVWSREQVQSELEIQRVAKQRLDKINSAFETIMARTINIQGETFQSGKKISDTSKDGRDSETKSQPRPIPPPSLKKPSTISHIPLAVFLMGLGLAIGRWVIKQIRFSAPWDAFAFTFVISLILGYLAWIIAGKLIKQINGSTKTRNEKIKAAWIRAALGFAVFLGILIIIPLFFLAAHKLKSFW